MDTFVAFNNCTLSNCFFVARIFRSSWEKCISLGLSKPLLQSISGFFYLHFNMEKDFKLATQYVAIWIFLGLCVVLLLQAWGIIPLNKF